MTGPAATSDDDLVPVSVRLGEVVPPEDPEDWTRPLTWMAALGMLLGPLVTLAWFLVAPPASSVAPLTATGLVACVVAVGAAATGATQIGALRAGTATLGGALFSALVTIIVGLVMAGERQIGAASPTFAHAFAGAAAGLVGGAVAALTAALVARLRSRLVRLGASGLGGAAVALAALGPLFGTA
ncbi:MAG TPA: hypothetical protein VLA76_09255 [Candidatus Angelobacter sp.]|nr:hypothetical protein [Candidatus Angelobacter sp.]